MTDVALGGQEQALPESVRRNPVEVLVMDGARETFAIWSKPRGWHHRPRTTRQKTLRRRL